MHTQPVSVFDAVKRIQRELDSLGVRDGDAVISTNIPTRLDGLPRSDAKNPNDPGAAVYWILNNRKECMATDRYNAVADNLAAIAATLDALRAIERHGGAEILERAFRGFTALPETTSGKSWRDVLNFHPSEIPTLDEARSRYREIARTRHPDTGGTPESFHELQWAINAALAELEQSAVMVKGG